MRTLVAAVLMTLACACIAAGCGGRDDSTPVACLEGKQAYLAALAGAPGTVKLAGETPISECLVENQQGGDLATMGEAMVAAATELNGEARDEPSGPAALQLGYLIGAADHGSDSTEGIHADLIRRLTVAARYAPGDEPLSAAFRDAYREGYEAGRAKG